MPERQPSGCLVSIFKLFSGSGGAAKTEGSTPLPYKRKDWLFSKAERSFFGVLQQAVSNEHLIFAKIRVGDLLWLPKGTEGRQSHWNRIQSKHIDFVLCDHVNIKPLLAIELDDSSHEREDRKQRDAFMEEAFKAAGLPLLRLPCKAGYSVNELAAQVRTAISQQTR